MSEPTFDDSCAIRPSTSSVLPVIFCGLAICVVSMSIVRPVSTAAPLPSDMKPPVIAYCAPRILPTRTAVVRIDLAGLRHVLLGEDLVEVRAIDEPDLRVRREIGDQQILNAGRHAVEVGLGRCRSSCCRTEHDDDRPVVALRQRERAGRANAAATASIRVACDS